MLLIIIFLTKYTKHIVVGTFILLYKQTHKQNNKIELIQTMLLIL